MTEIAETYRRRADRFEALVAGVQPDQWSNPSPCDEWDARAVVGHVLDMHGVVYRGLDREPPAGPALADDPLGAFRAARAGIEALLEDPTVAGAAVETPAGPSTVEAHIDQVPSADLVIHGWDLARATEQDDTIDADELDRLWPGVQQMPDEMRTPGAFGPGIVVFGPEVPVPADAPIQARVLGLLGRDPDFSPKVPT